MTYVNDILLNFHPYYFEFFDWNIADNIIHIKQIPIFSIKQKELDDIMSSDVVFGEHFLKQIKKKTEQFNENGITSLNYAALLCTFNKVIAVKLNERGKIVSYSSLLIDEEYSILKEFNGIKKDFIEYKLGKLKEKRINKTRNELKQKKYINNKIKESDTAKLEFILYAITNDEIKSRNKIINKLTSLIEKNRKEIFNLLK